ncbi:FAD-dependent oxidoreductase [Nodosilinea sp. LEGE 06152]|uniref:FAD-dependent monooxygenase n=1 Tax=Nodosilinea sp. LEGE 06152 TaxID=2777966 RepID=UPI00188268A2|nr:FAD-dependent monooxygenase [Nodosilinea sp. LEGE 06152]MBE9160463.1 FAD-dependent oxidoreductase [Nodosilinea sp. LEGE 06152]
MPKVVIVGAGPTGATLALMLAQRGVPITLIEAARDFKRQFRGEALMPSGLDALSQMGLNPLLKTIPHRPLSAWEFWLNDRRLFRVDEPLGSARPCTLVSQPPLLEALVQAAQRNPNFEWIAGTTVKDLLWQSDGEASQTENRVTGVHLTDGRTLQADLVIGADGRASVIRQKAELTLKTQPKSIDVLWFKLPAPSGYAADNRFCTVVKSGRVFSLFHGAEEGKMHLAWAIAPEEPTEQKDWATTFAALVPPELVEHFRAVGDNISSPLRLSVVVGRCDRWHRPGLLLLGDAAHPMSPVRAQGINLALRDVIVAINHLVPVLQRSENAASAAIDRALVSIQAEREPEIIQAQKLQAHEASRGELLRRFEVLRQGLSQFSPLVGPLVKRVWTQQQRPLREGITPVRLEV